MLEVAHSTPNEHLAQKIVDYLLAGVSYVVLVEIDGDVVMEEYPHDQQPPERRVEVFLYRAGTAHPVGSWNIGTDAPGQACDAPGVMILTFDAVVGVNIPWPPGGLQVDLWEVKQTLVRFHLL